MALPESVAAPVVSPTGAKLRGCLRLWSRRSNPMRRFTLGWPVAVVLLCASLAWAEGTPQAREILNKANAAAQKLGAIAFEAEYKVDGDFVGKFPQVSGRVLAVRGEAGKANR